jgi:hypothetical protein
MPTERAVSAKKTASKGRVKIDEFSESSSRFTIDVDHDAASRRRARLHAMRNAAEMISDLPIFRTRLCLNGGALLHVLAVHLCSAATDVGADRRSRYSAAGGGDVPAPSAADLVAKHSADYCSGNRTRYVGRIAAVFDDLLALDPTALLGRADHSAHGAHRHFV